MHTFWSNQVPFPKELWEKVSDDAKDFIKVRCGGGVAEGKSTIVGVT